MPHPHDRRDLVEVGSISRSRYGVVALHRLVQERRLSEQAKGFCKDKQHASCVDVRTGVTVDESSAIVDGSCR